MKIDEGRVGRFFQTRCSEMCHKSYNIIIIIIIIIIHAFITYASSVMILNQRHWQSLARQHGKGVDGLFEKVSFQTVFEGVKSG